MVAMRRICCGGTSGCVRREVPHFREQVQFHALARFLADGRQAVGAEAEVDARPASAR